MDVQPERSHTPVWRDPLTLGFRAHRQVLLLRLRWLESRDTRASGRRRPRNQGRHDSRRP